jgi:NAD(P)-dependent dehydrogenase (short-subunit alcohol dehydrogenase family)
VAPLAPFDLVIDATGALIIAAVGPEKRLAALSAQALMQQFAVNAVGPALVMRHALPWLAKDRRVIYAKLSARVGSIEDNHKGGWYGYRAAKAALNQLLQTAAIECARTRPLAVVAALQPGTVASPLSQPFVPVAQTLAPAASAAGLLCALDTLEPSARAQFVDHAGQTIPW